MSDYKFVAVTGISITPPEPTRMVETGDKHYPIDIREGSPGRAKMEFIYEGDPTVDDFVEAVRHMFREGA